MLLMEKIQPTYFKPNCIKSKSYGDNNKHNNCNIKNKISYEKL